MLAVFEGNIFFSRWNFAFYILLTILLKHPINILSACSARGCPYNIPATSYSYAHHLSVCVLNFWFQHPTDHPNQHPIIIPYRFRGGGARFPIIVDPASYHIGYVHIQLFNVQDGTCRIFIKQNHQIHVYIRIYSFSYIDINRFTHPIAMPLPSDCHPNVAVPGLCRCILVYIYMRVYVYIYIHFHIYVLKHPTNILRSAWLVLLFRGIYTHKCSYVHMCIYTYK